MPSSSIQPFLCTQTCIVGGIDHSRIRHKHARENMKVRLGWTNIKHGGQHLHFFAVAVANIVVSLVAKVPFITIRGKKLIFHFFLFLCRQKVGIGGFWQLKDKKTETDLL